MEFARLRPMVATEILDGAFTLYRRHFTTLVLTALVPVLPGLLVIPLHRLAGQGLQLLGSVVVLGALIHLASEAALGRQPRMGAGLKVGLRRFFPILLGSIAYTFLVLGGLVLLIVPGFCMFCMCFAWQPIVVLEKRTSFFSRSRALARDQWGKISGVMLIAIIIAFLPGIALNVSAMGILKLGYAAASQSLLVVLGTALLGALVGPFSNAVVTLLYYDQRVRKEGLDVQLAVEAMGGEGQSAAVPAAARPVGR
jgi:hypothetical protein